MRITAGKLKGRHLQFKSKNVRPTSEKVREALFNILGAQVSEARFLDLFSGSGAIGIEALSRGAHSVVFVEKYPSLVFANLTTLALLDCCQIIKQDALKSLDMLNNKSEQFDIVYIDPPYDSQLLELSLAKLGAQNLLTPQGKIIAEHSCRQKLQANYGSITQYKSAKYGEIELTFYR